MNKPVNSVAAEWAWFLENVLIRDEHTTAEGVAEFRALFYAGAKACVRAITEAPEPNAALAAIEAELADFGQGVMRSGKLPR